MFTTWLFTGGKKAANPCLKILVHASSGFPGGLVVKNLPANARDASSVPCWEDPLEKEVATHSNILDCEILWTEEPGRLQSMRSQESQTWVSD